MGFFSKLKQIGRKRSKVEGKRVPPIEPAKKIGEKQKSSGEGEKKIKNIELKKEKKNIAGNAYKIVLKPIISEKAAIAEASGVYSFIVASNSNKTQIKSAIKQLYGIEPRKVRVVNMEGKWSRHGKSLGRRKDWKKAIVTLPKGQIISVHEGV